jgi:hypothetical protein
MFENQTTSSPSEGDGGGGFVGPETGVAHELRDGARVPRIPSFLLQDFFVTMLETDEHGQIIGMNRGVVDVNRGIREGDNFVLLNKTFLLGDQNREEAFLNSPPIRSITKRPNVGYEYVIVCNDNRRFVLDLKRAELIKEEMGYPDNQLSSISEKEMPDDMVDFNVESIAETSEVASKIGKEGSMFRGFVQRPVTVGTPLVINMFGWKEALVTGPVIEIHKTKDGSYKIKSTDIVLSFRAER